MTTYGELAEEYEGVVKGFQKALDSWEDVLEHLLKKNGKVKTGMKFWAENARSMIELEKRNVERSKKQVAYYRNLSEKYD